MRMTAFLLATSVPAALFAHSELSQNSRPAPQPHEELDRVTACEACHGTDGVAVFAPAPNLAGQKAAYLEAQLHSFREGTRKSDFMNPVAAQLTDSEIKALAAHFASLPGAGSASREQRAGSAVATRILLPASFPAGFKEYARSEDPQSATLTISYANGLVFDAVHSGTHARPGAMIVVETASAKRDSSGRLLHDSAGHLVPGGATSYSVSATGTGWGERVPSTLRNADWNYAQFDAGMKLRTTNQAACLACHRSTAKTDFVFGVDDIRRSAGDH
jgi:cytochrome c553